MPLAVQATPGFETSYSIGIVIGMLLPLIFALLAFKTFSDPQRSWKCALSMVLMMGGWFLCSAGVGVAQWTGIDGAQTLSIILGAPLGLASGVFAVLGLIDVVGSKRPLHGSWQAIVCLILIGLFMLIAFLGALTKLRERVPKDWQMEQPVAGSRIEVSSKNFSFAVPGGEWAQVVPGKLNSQADLAFINPKRQMYFMVLAHRLAAGASLPQEKFVEIARGEITQMDPGAVLDLSQEETVGPLSGTAFTAKASAKGKPVAYREWVCVHGGFVYQLVAWGQRSQSAAVTEAATRLFQGFRPTAP